MTAFPRVKQASVFIDTAALQHNAAVAASLNTDPSSNSRLLAVIKANGYGHGLFEVADSLLSIADGFAVARLDEAISLRQHLTATSESIATSESMATSESTDTSEKNTNRKSIVVMSALLDSDALDSCATHGITPVLYSSNQLAQQLAFCEQKQLPYWLKFDSGMHRLGLNEIEALAQRDLSLCQTIMTHFKSADENAPTAPIQSLTQTQTQTQNSPSFINQTSSQQLEQFSQTVDRLLALPGTPSSLAISIFNSAALLANAAAEQSNKTLAQLLARKPIASQWIRAGIMLYGADPLQQASTASQQLQSAMTFLAPIIDIRRLSKGETVGYNGTWQASQDSVIATVAAGYADGYPRHAKNGTPVVIHGQRAELVGRVSMDMITVDITALLNKGIDIHIGDSAELWGRQLNANIVAEHADTIAYALFTGVTQRVHRQVYTDTSA